MSWFKIECLTPWVISLARELADEHNAPVEDIHRQGVRTGVAIEGMDSVTESLLRRRLDAAEIPFEEVDELDPWPPKAGGTGEEDGK